MVSKGNTTTSFIEIRERVTDAELVQYYLGINKVPCFICSPLRQDKRPSFGLYSNDGKRIFFTDLATKERGGMYDLLSKLWHCSIRETMQRIERDFMTGKSKVDISVYHSSRSPVITSNNDSTLEVKIREWKQYDLDYWESYGITLNWLKYAEVYPISHKIITKEGRRYTFGADKYAYVFVEHKEGKVTLKIYQPFNKEGYKWANKHDRSVISLWTKIPEKGNILIICSSLKDALCLMSNTGIPAIALQGEGYGISDTAVKELKKRYDRIYVLYDNDTAGILDSQKLCGETGFINLILPQFNEGKDISDYRQAKGKQAFVDMIHKLLLLVEDRGQDVLNRQ